MSQQAKGDRRLPSDPFNPFADVPNELNLQRGQTVSSDYSDATRWSTQVDPEKARNQLGMTRVSEEQTSGPFKVLQKRWKTTWRLQTTIIGLYLCAVACACAHWRLLEFLDGRTIVWDDPSLAWNAPMLEKTTIIPQSWATTISILLVRAFTAALVGTIGLCYTQNLWATLRQRTLKIGLIEDLFQIQNSAFQLVSFGLYSNAPVLAAIAMFCWILPIATAFLPGALIVELGMLPVNTKFNASVFHAKDYMNADPSDSWSNILCNHPGNSTRMSLREITRQNSQNINDTVLATCQLRGVSHDAHLVARTSILSGEIANLYQPGEPNSSYSLEFWGPTLGCETNNRTMENSPGLLDIMGRDYFRQLVRLSDDYPSLRDNPILFDLSDDSPSRGPPFYTQLGEGQWGIRNLSSCGITSDLPDLPVFNASTTTDIAPIIHRTIPWHSDGVTDTGFPSIRSYPCLGGAPKNLYTPMPYGRLFIITSTVETICRPRPARYYVNVSSTEFRQHVSWSVDNDGDLPAYTPYFESFNGSLEQWVQFSDAFSIYLEFAATLKGSYSSNHDIRFNRTNANATILTAYTLSNGTTVDTCTLSAVDGRPRASLRDATNTEIWASSVFERRLPGNDTYTGCPRFDTKMANELLINTTISSLALQKLWNTVDGTATRTFNVYRFQNKLAFFISYGASLALGIPIIVLGLLSFRIHNGGVSAIKGGFLQILMTTTGRTELEDIIHKNHGTLGGEENVSDELKAVEVRFGELIEVRNRARSVSPADSRGSDGQASGIGEARRVQHGREDLLTMDTCNELVRNQRSLRRAGFGLAHEVRPLRRRNIGS